MRNSAWLAICLCLPALAQVRMESPVWSPDAKRIVFAKSLTGKGTDWNLYLANSDGSGVRQLTSTGAWDPVWSPDGTTIAFVATVDGKRQISSMAVDRQTLRQLTSGEGESFHPAWSPKAGKLAFTCRSGSSSRICVMNEDGSDIHPVTNASQQCRWPTWSSDGERIAYDARGEVWSTNLRTGERLHLFTTGPAASTLDWSPDGQQILFAGEGDKGLQVYDIPSHEIRRVLGGDLRPAQPRWSPDGRRILFAGNAKPGIYTLNPDTSEVRTLITDH